MTKEEANFLRHGVGKLLALHRDGLTPIAALIEITQFIDANDADSNPSLTERVELQSHDGKVYYVPPFTGGKEVSIDMILFCPVCGSKHIDAAEGEWTNPPHKSHLCGNCRTVWRPADIVTNGVAKIKTRGENDTWWPK